ncbi:hypothetical protein bthur0012_3060 [Bacillus thuringiensis serovar pulsiensis BGSC 4CC1]|nr:hypothetical protein bthur0012_3060 [Bacillus thuringiensis serovar pulsiensis BGSC 4CC1]
MTSGHPIEVWLKDEGNPRLICYVTTNIEHSGRDYYAVRLGRGVPLEGICGRIKQ